MKSRTSKVARRVQGRRPHPDELLHSLVPRDEESGHRRSGRGSGRHRGVHRGGAARAGRDRVHARAQRPHRLRRRAQGTLRDPLAIHGADLGIVKLSVKEAPFWGYGEDQGAERSNACSRRGTRSSSARPGERSSTRRGTRRAGYRSSSTDSSSRETRSSTVRSGGPISRGAISTRSSPRYETSSSPCRTDDRLLRARAAHDDRGGEAGESVPRRFLTAFSRGAAAALLIPPHIGASRQVLEKSHDRRGIQHAELIGDVCQPQNTRNSCSGSFEKMAEHCQGVESDLQE